jgi:Fur family ferric uptake transcriptional regulator
MSKNKKSVEMEKVLKEQGFRMTLPRRVILDLFSKSDGHLLAKDIYIKINNKFPDIGLTTVYRTLDLLVQKGMINKFDLGEGQSRYELAWDFKEHHHHLVCSKCGKMIDYNDFIDDEINFFADIQKFLSKKYNFQINNHEVYFYGKCNSCKDNA